MSSPGRCSLIRLFAVSGIMTYFEMASIFSGTRVKILPESKSRFLSFIRLRIPSFEFSATA